MERQMGLGAGNGASGKLGVLGGGGQGSNTDITTSWLCDRIHQFLCISELCILPSKTGERVVTPTTCTFGRISCSSQHPEVFISHRDSRTCPWI